jgi:FlaA1/EpsC-like NDP-sugar epimerase
MIADSPTSARDGFDPSAAEPRKGSAGVWRSLPRHIASGLRIHGPTWVAECLVLCGAFAAAFAVRYGGHIPAGYTGRRAILSAALVVAAYTVSSLFYRSYRIVWRFASVWDVVQLAITVVTTALLIALVELLPFRADRPIPLSTLAIGAVLGYLALGHIKLLPRLRTSMSWGAWGEPLIVFGAGLAGVALVRQLQTERGGFRPVAFLDDDRHKVGRDISGVPVLGDRSELAAVMKRSRAQNLALALPSAPQETIRALTRLGGQVGARVLLVPSVHDMLADPSGRIPLREVAMEDLLGRSEVFVDVGALRATFEGKRILVTGAAGSIGSELVRQLRSLDPTSIIMLDNNESGLTDLRDLLEPTGAELVIRVASVHDEPGIRRVFAELRPEVVIHAAALKHVDLVEAQPHEAVRVNVLGTWNCAKLAEEMGVKTFVLISTDKAVDPVGVLGTSKRLGELMIAALADSDTLFTAVRFGNVIGSRGSVLPRFELQIKQGGPLTVTHANARRFFMSVDEAVRLVLQSAAMAERGRIYVLDMGEEVSIVSLAIRLAGLHGLRVPDDIEIEYTGMRPGERMHEALVGAGEALSPTAHSKVSALTGFDAYHRDDLESLVTELRALGSATPAAVVRQRLLQLSAMHLTYGRSSGPRPPQGASPLSGVRSRDDTL